MPTGTGTCSSPGKRRSITVAANSASSFPAAFRVSCAMRSSLEIAAGNNAAKFGGGMELARRAKSKTEFSCQLCSKLCVSLDSAIFASRSVARSKAATTERPIQCADPSSPIANPQPPARSALPCRSRPYAKEPVPAFTTTPGPRAKTASSAISMSPTTTIGVGTS